MLWDTLEFQEIRRKGGHTYLWLNEVNQLVFPETVWYLARKNIMINCLCYRTECTVFNIVRILDSQYSPCSE